MVRSTQKSTKSSRKSNSSSRSSRSSKTRTRLPLVQRQETHPLFTTGQSRKQSIIALVSVALLLIISLLFVYRGEFVGRAIESPSFRDCAESSICFFDGDQAVDVGFFEVSESISLSVKAHIAAGESLDAYSYVVSFDRDFFTGELLPFVYQESDFVDLLMVSDNSYKISYLFAEPLVVDETGFVELGTLELVAIPEFPDSVPSTVSIQIDSFDFVSATSLSPLVTSSLDAPYSARVAVVEDSASSFTASCGQSISEPGTYVLTEDLICPGEDGLFIDSSDVSLDCNGFAIEGDKDNPSGYGIIIEGGSIDGRNIQVTDCVIKHFAVGVVAEAADSVFQELELTHNLQAIDGYLDNSIISESLIWQNEEGINLDLRSGKVLLSENVICSNPVYDLQCDSGSRYDGPELLDLDGSNNQFDTYLGSESCYNALLSQATNTNCESVSYVQADDTVLDDSTTDDSSTDDSTNVVATDSDQANVVEQYDSTLLVQLLDDSFTSVSSASRSRNNFISVTIETQEDALPSHLLLVQVTLADGTVESLFSQYKNTLDPFSSETVQFSYQSSSNLPITVEAFVWSDWLSLGGSVLLDSVEAEYESSS